MYAISYILSSLIFTKGKTEMFNLFWKISFGNTVLFEKRILNPKKLDNEFKHSKGPV